MTRILLRIATAALLIIAALAYLRDPGWLGSMTSGMREWQSAPDGRRFRVSSGHASLFVPSGLTSITIPLRPAIETSDRWPVVAAIAVDDRPAEEVVLDGPDWRLVTIRLAGHTTRRVRRIDIRASRADENNRALEIGDIH